MKGTGIHREIGQVYDFAWAGAAKALNVLVEDYVIRILIGAAIGLLKLGKRGRLIIRDDLVCRKYVTPALRSFDRKIKTLLSLVRKKMRKFCTEKFVYIELLYARLRDEPYLINLSHQAAGYVRVASDLDFGLLLGLFVLVFFYFLGGVRGGVYL